MIAYLAGDVLDAAQDPIVVFCHGVGYEVHVGLRALTQVQEGASVRLHVTQVVRENAIELFGFLDKQEKTMFGLLCQVPKIGSRTAMAILGTMRLDELLSALTHNDATALTRVPGIGKKTAGLLLVTLRDLAANYSLQGVQSGAITSASSEAVEALVALGFDRSDAQRKVKLVLQDQPEAGTDLVVRKVLQGI